MKDDSKQQEPYREHDFTMQYLGNQSLESCGAPGKKFFRHCHFVIFYCTHIFPYILGKR
jgi:hypothetical protein